VLLDNGQLTSIYSFNSWKSIDKPFSKEFSRI
jgi:hypothetical protein